MLFRAASRLPLNNRKSILCRPKPVFLPSHHQEKDTTFHYRLLNDTQVVIDEVPGGEVLFTNYVTDGYCMDALRDGSAIRFHFFGKNLAVERDESDTHWQVRRLTLERIRINLATYPMTNDSVHILNREDADYEKDFTGPCAANEP